MAACGSGGGGSGGSAGGASDALAQAIEGAAAGSVIELAPGRYRGKIFRENLQGTPSAPIVITAADPAHPPVVSGSEDVGIHLVDAAHVHFSHLVVEGFSGAGINVDDGGSFSTPSHHVTFEDVAFRNIGSDALKLSGVDDFAVRGSHFDGWGESAIDAVGCHRGVVEDSVFLGKGSALQGVSIKGGSTDVLVQTSFFRGPIHRGVAIGGSTDLEFFRPAPGNFEARRITVGGNRFATTTAPVAWVTADGGTFHHNTVSLPQGFAGRILQESDDSRFRPSHDGVYRENVIVYDNHVTEIINVGPGTAPGTFQFRRNAWFRTDGPTDVSLPAPEASGVYGVDPDLQDAVGPSMHVGSSDPRLAGLGADGYVRP